MKIYKKHTKNIKKINLYNESKQYIFYFFSQGEFLASAEADSENEAIRDLEAQGFSSKQIDFKTVYNKKDDSYYAGNYYSRHKNYYKSLRH